MKRVAFLMLLLVGVLHAAENWNGWLDTSNIDGFRVDSLKYSKAWDLGRYENVAVVVKANDSSSAGFSSDSIALK
jgi:glycosidase